MEPASQLSSASGVRARSRVHARYRPLFVVGKGGMGSVEVAVEKRDGGFQRIVALKRLLPETNDARHTEMFLREARLAALLSHPNVVHAFDFGEEDGELFLAMEYVEGASFARVLSEEKRRGTRLPLAVVLHVLGMVCEGLSAVHELKDVDGSELHVVHRDVSPQNVMLSFSGHVKILDFGVAKIERDQGLSRTGEVKGKVSYMSPEQALGDPLDGRSDLFAVGAMLYEALVGERMWGDGTDMDVLRKLALDAPPKLPARRDGDSEPLPASLISLYDQLVAKKPVDRPTSARDVADVLAKIAAETGAVSPQRAISARMADLFGEDIEARRTELARRLEETVPEIDAKALRESIEPPAPATIEAPPSARPTRTLSLGERADERAPERVVENVEDLAVDHADARASGVLGPRRSRTPLVVGGALVLVGMLVVSTWASMRDRENPPPQPNAGAASPSTTPAMSPLPTSTLATSPALTSTSNAAPAASVASTRSIASTDAPFRGALPPSAAIVPSLARSATPGSPRVLLPSASASAASTASARASAAPSVPLGTPSASVANTPKPPSSSSVPDVDPHPF